MIASDISQPSIYSPKSSVNIGGYKLSFEQETGELYRNQFLSYQTKGDYYTINIEGVEFKFSKYNVDGYLRTSNKNTNINDVIRNVDSKVLYYLVNNAKEQKWASVELNSLWRNSEGSPHIRGMSVDFASITKNGIAVFFRNDSAYYNSQFMVGTPAWKLRKEIFSSLFGDDKVQRVLDPLALKSNDPKIYNYENR